MPTKYTQYIIQTLNDGATINLAPSISGFLDVWEDTEWIRCFINTNGNVALIQGSANTANTDTAGKLCVYDGGAYAVIKNNLGSAKVIRYNFLYS